MSDSDEIAIKVEHVSKNFVLPHEKISSVKSLFTSAAKKRRGGKTETQHALKDISFEIKKGEFFGIVGRNGSGKSTMLKILAGIYQPTSGTVQTHGKLVPFIELGVGFNPELTGRENVYLNGALLGFNSKQIDYMYEDIVEFAELERFMDQKLKNYSSGMQVRLAFSMATRSEADILLIDEVLAVGDADFQRKCFDYFRTLKKNKKTVVFVSHDMIAVREYCDRAAFIEKSNLVDIGTADKIAGQYTKLFSQASEGAEEESGGRRWGESVGLIQSATVPKKINSDNKELAIKLKIKCNTQLTNPIIGYIIKNSVGQSIMGSNTKMLRIVTGDHAPGNEFSIEFLLKNVFSDGNYQVDVALLDSDAVTVLDWWDSANHFTVFEEITSPYLTSPDVKVTVKEG